MSLRPNRLTAAIEFHLTRMRARNAIARHWQQLQEAAAFDALRLAGGR